MTETGIGIGTEIGNFICQQTWQRKRVEKYATAAAAAEGTLLIPAKRPHHVDDDDDDESRRGERRLSSLKGGQTDASGRGSWLIAAVRPKQ